MCLSENDPNLFATDLVRLKSTGHCNMRLDTLSLTTILAENNQRNPFKGILSEMV